MLKQLPQAGLVQGKTIGFDATALEANAALRTLVRRDTGQDYETFVKAHKAMSDAAQSRGLISYSDLAERTTSCILGPPDPRLARLFGDISTEEDEAGRGMLSRRGRAQDGRPETGTRLLHSSDSTHRHDNRLLTAFSMKLRCWTFGTIEFGDPCSRRG